MKYSGGILPLKSQKPFIQLLVALMIILLVSLVLLSLTMLSGRLIFGMGIVDINAEVLEISSSQRAYIKFIQAFQHISIFLIPSLCVAYLMTGSMSGYLKLKSFPDPAQAMLVLFLAMVLIPFIGDLGIWNSRLTLPPWLSPLETWMSQKEAEAAKLTGWLIYSGTIGSLIINIIIIAILPALGEEFLFRGLFQDIFTGIFKSPHIAILFTALLFSVFHLQFYGLVPRMVLGLVYGYLFYWSGTLWLPVFAHFLNNLVPVIVAHLFGWEQMNNEIQDFIRGEGYSFLIPLILSVLLMLVIRYQSKESNSVK